jgi:plasmid stabilization system protein ParE
MSRVILSRRARQDLKDVGAFIAQHNQMAAKNWVAKLRSVCKATIGMFPLCGTKCDHLRPGMRCFSVGSYVISFEGRNPVRILRIVNGAVDFDRLTFVD